MVSTLHKTTDTLGDNMGLVAAVIAVVVAQILKPFSEWTVSGRFKPGLAVGSGGFPSSHSSLVTALATGAAYQVGLADPAFATALVLALVVMYDAMGVRRQAGYHATAINNLVTAFPSDVNLRRPRDGAANAGGPANIDAREGLESGLINGGGYQSGGTGARHEDEDALLGGVGESIQQGFQDFLAALQERPLREHIGHTPVQVLAGGVLGVVVGSAYAFALRVSEGPVAPAA